MFLLTVLVAIGAPGLVAAQNASIPWLNNPLTSSLQIPPMITTGGVAAQETTLTETINGIPATITFGPTTLSDYTALSSTTTITSTTTDANGTPIPIPVIVGPGGSGWIPIIPPGGAPPPPGFVPPAVPPPIIPIGDGPGGSDSNPTSDVPSSTVSSSIASSSGACPTIVGAPDSADEFEWFTTPAWVNGDYGTMSAPPPSSTAPPPPPSTTMPAAPAETSSNNKGSGLCPSLSEAVGPNGENMCQLAYTGYLDDYTYTQYTSYTLTADSALNEFSGMILGGLFGYEGCAAMFTCDDYSVGMTGAQIKSAFDNLFANDDVKVCGSSYLDNGCHVTVNGCNDCQDTNVPPVDY